MGVKKRARVYERAGAPTRRKGFPLKFHRNKRNTTGNKIKDLTGEFWNARFISVFPCGEVMRSPLVPRRFISAGFLFGGQRRNQSASKC